MKIRIIDKVGLENLFPDDIYIVEKMSNDCYHLIGCKYVIHKDRCEIVNDNPVLNIKRSVECPCGINRKDCEYHR